MQEGTTTLCGLRRELTKDLFEELAALQCTTEEILGYIGTTEKKLESWCRKTYRHPLAEMIPMIRKDGLIAIRRASFDQRPPSGKTPGQAFNDARMPGFQKENGIGRDFLHVQDASDMLQPFHGGDVQMVGRFVQQ